MITAKEILKDKGNIYKNMSKAELGELLVSNKVSYDDFAELKAYFKLTSQNIIHINKKLWQRWHYKDGRPKPPRVHEVTRLREIVKAKQKALESAMFDVVQCNFDMQKHINEALKYESLYGEAAEKNRNYEEQNHLKNIQIINLQGEVSKASNTTKIVAFISGVIILALILIPYFE